MNHTYLSVRSENFVDDFLESVEKRCFFLMCGRQATDAALTIDLVVNAFDEPDVKKKITMSMILD